MIARSGSGQADGKKSSLGCNRYDANGPAGQSAVSPDPCFPRSVCLPVRLSLYSTSASMNRRARAEVDDPTHPDHVVAGCASGAGAECGERSLR